MMIPTYVLSKDHNIGQGNRMLTLPAGSFVKPIDYRYLPMHIKESASPYQNLDQGSFCYTRFGIIWIPKDIIRTT